MVIYSDKGGRLSFVTLDALTEKISGEFSREGYDFFDADIKEGVVSFKARKNTKGILAKNQKQKAMSMIEEKINFPFIIRPVSNLPFDKQNVSFMGATDFSSWMLDLHFMTIDKLQDHMLYADITGNSSYFLMGNLGYADLKKDWGVNASIRRYYDNLSASALGVKQFTLSKYMKFGLYGGYEFQNSYVAKKKSSLKTGVLYGIDTTRSDWYGPISGSRFFFRSEFGYGLENEFNNLDLNADIRQYFRIIDKAGIALRAAAGTSQGDYPTMYVFGGWDDVKGADLFSLYSQNYYLAASEFRFPLFDLLGGILPGKLRSLTAFTAAFDVRGSLFSFVSDSWTDKHLGNNLDNLKLGVPDWGVGYGVKFMTGFGLQLGISHTLYGKIDTPDGRRSGLNPGWNMSLWSNW